MPTRKISSGGLGALDSARAKELWTISGLVKDRSFSSKTSTVRGHVVCCDRRVGEADPVAQSAAATAAVEHSKSQK